MSNSPLVDYVLISPNKSSPRVYPITKITIHHMAGQLSVEQCGKIFQSRQASSNYGIGTDGRVGMYCEEKDRSWCSCSYDNDNRAITIECANDGGSPDWHVSDVVLNKLIDLCVDICQRNGIPKLIYTGDSSGNLTRHNMFWATACPGEYLQSKFPWIAEQVNARLEGGEGDMYRLKIGYASGGDIRTFETMLNNMKVGYATKDGYITTQKMSESQMDTIMAKASALVVPCVVIEIIPSPTPTPTPDPEPTPEPTPTPEPPVDWEKKYNDLLDEYYSYRKEVGSAMEQIIYTAESVLDL